VPSQISPRHPPMLLPSQISPSVARLLPPLARAPPQPDLIIGHLSPPPARSCSSLACPPARPDALVSAPGPTTMSAPAAPLLLPDPDAAAPKTATVRRQGDSRRSMPRVQRPAPDTSQASTRHQPSPTPRPQHPGADPDLGAPARPWRPVPDPAALTPTPQS
jgi:hypothetical protein